MRRGRRESCSSAGIFISYSHADAPFVDKLYKRLKSEGAAVWLDRHDITAGRIERQVLNAVRVNDVVLLVLSKDSLASDWVQLEVKKAREKEKEQGRDVLCPVAVDDAWKSDEVGVEMPQRLIEQLKEYAILDFSKWWDNDAFEEQFKKLLTGLKVHYPKGPPDE